MARTGERLAGLDVLRGVAVLLVFARHVPILPQLHLGWGEHVLDLFVEAGWLGVDLFFVLSGFLIAGVLFSEVRRRGTVSLGRFWFRRGMKIWPCFFVVYGFWITAHLIAGTDRSYHTATLLPNVFFVQNYFDLHHRLAWPASWSLAVEEHFYLALPLLLAGGVAVGRGWGRARIRAGVVAVGAIGCAVPLAFRVWEASPGVDFLAIYLPTHCRFDTLLIGVLLRYLYDFEPAAFALVARRATVAAPILVAGAVLLAVRYPVIAHTEIHAWGFTLNALAAAAVIAAAVGRPVTDVPRRSGAFASALGWVGRYSYTLYLVHAVIFRMPWMPAALEWWEAVCGSGAPLHLWGYRAAYWGLSILVGYALARLVEQPVLRWRDRVWPGRRAEAPGDAAVYPHSTRLPVTCHLPAESLASASG